jgi:hypothetical protein
LKGQQLNAECGGQAPGSLLPLSWKEAARLLGGEFPDMPGACADKVLKNNETAAFSPVHLSAETGKAQSKAVPISAISVSLGVSKLTARESFEALLEHWAVVH